MYKDYNYRIKQGLRPTNFVITFHSALSYHQQKFLTASLKAYKGSDTDLTAERIEIAMQNFMRKYGFRGQIRDVAMDAEITI